MRPAPTEEQNINPHKSSLPGDYFTKTPTYDGKPKEFPSKSKKPLQLTTKAYLVQKIDRKGIEDIQPKEQMIDFNKLLLQFKSVQEVEALQVSDLLDIDADLLEDLKKNAKISLMQLHIYLMKKKKPDKAKKLKVINNLCNI
jgi:hypothetical protein